MAFGTLTPATPTPGALIVDAGRVRYPAPGMDNGDAVASKREA
jgi:hypothetical protein